MKKQAELTTQDGVLELAGATPIWIWAQPRVRQTQTSSQNTPRSPVSQGEGAADPQVRMVRLRAMQQSHEAR